MPKTPPEIADIIPEGYALEPGSYDEMWDQKDGVRTHWHPFFSAIERMGSKELARRDQEARLLLRENGVTYNVHGDPDGLHRPWELDPIPLLLQANDWTHIARGVSQRAELLNLVLKDIYGPQTLIREGLLPFELIYNHANFLRSCKDVFLPSEHHLRVYAANLARGPDGQMWVLYDHTQAPSGLGYALENRTAMSRIMPALFNDCNVRRLADFFRTFQAGLSEIAPHDKEAPRIVVLTPGPFNATYFEHAYLSAYLGYTLAQGDDLTVRDGRVWLKSIDGLHPVDIILRRINDDFCDPLELNEESQIGVAGLLDAVRNGHVAIANPLGSSVLENPGLMPFLPGIARHLLGEDLILPSVATWWCGQAREMNYVLDHLDSLVLCPIDRQSVTHRVFGALLSRAEREAWRDRIRANPTRYAALEHVSFATSPSLINGHLESRYTTLTTFAVSHQNTYAVMPGGLTRRSPERGNFIVPTHTFAHSKDTWVIDDRPESYTSLWQQTGGSSTSYVLPSRAAENLFWVGRYAERAEGGIRLVRAIVNNLTDRRKNEDDACRVSLLHALTCTTDTFPGFVGTGADDRLRNPEKEILSVINDDTRQGSLSFTIRAFVQAAFVIRDRWSADTWRVIDGIESQWTQVRKNVELLNVQNALNQVLTGLLAFTGLTQESMTRELGWHLLDTGRRIERILLQIALLRCTLTHLHPEDTTVPAGGLEDQLVLESVLSITETLITHRRRHRTYISMETVLELLLHDESNPRALAYQMIRLADHMAQLPRLHNHHRPSEEERLILDASTQLRLSDPTSLAHGGLDPLLSHLETQVRKASEILSHTYFSHARNTRQLAPTHRNFGA